MDAGRYEWAESHEVAQYTNWARSTGQGDTDEPDGGEAENCVFMTLDFDPDLDIGPGWSDCDCSRRLLALCEYDGDSQPSTTPTQPTSTTTEPSTTTESATTTEPATTTTPESTTQESCCCGLFCFSLDPSCCK